ncbi:MAG: sulfurtransferase [Myxococcales bacterium]|nr:sulfurtransferase [Myxococcales bacterium]MCB9714911.1 sulfurtransferase [Myxococcales bacterium]
MPHETLVDVPTLVAHLRDPAWLVVDCRFQLADPGAGERLHAEATIPGSIYAHLDRDLSRPIIPGRTGRHPLPAREVFASTLGRWGLSASTQVVAFDDMGGAFASRLWWMLRWVGHRAAAVLDGGLPAWTAAGQRLEPGHHAAREPTSFTPGEALVETVDADQVLALLDDPSVVLLDARALPRFTGEEESTDPVAGHIAGARSAPFMDNLGPSGRFLPADRLRARFVERLGGTEPDRAVAYCGSGVTACHDLLAMTHAGLPMARLYSGSWSDWINDPSRPWTAGPET